MPVSGTLFTLGLPAFGSQGSAPGPTGDTLLSAEGAWSQTNELNCRYIGGNLYLGAVTGTATGGDAIMTQRIGAVSTTRTIFSNFEVDAHADVTLLQLPGGRLMTLASKHSSETAGLRYKVSTNPLPDTSVFNSTVTISNGGVTTSYTKPYLLSDGIVRVYFRSGGSTTRPYNVAKAPATNIEAGTATWAVTSVIQTTGARPYVKNEQDGDRIHWFVTNGHPNEVATSLYHFYMELIGGVERYFKSDGTEIVAALPFDPVAEATLIQNTVGGTNWNWDITVGADGRPRVLATRYPSAAGAAIPRDVPQTDIEYWHYRWTGAAWTGFKLVGGQFGLYLAENCYVGGLVFDALDATRVFAAISINGVYEMVEWSINEALQTKTLVRTITANSPFNNIRPRPVFNYAPGGYRAVWMRGRFTTYTDYDTALYGST